MIYPFITVPAPDLGGFVLHQGNVHYKYVYVGEALVGANGRRRKPKARSIGRLITDEQGEELLIPNNNYYEIMGLSQPESAVAEGPGRKPYKRVAQPMPEREQWSEVAVGYGLAILIMSAQLGLSAALENAFGAATRERILALAAYLCEERHSSLAGLNNFIGRNLGLLSDVQKFARREAGQLLVELSAPGRGKFYDLWNQQQTNRPKEIFYDVTSISTYSPRLRKAHFGCNRDGEDDLRQVNEGLFCDRENGRPLYLCCYDGSLTDCQNFNYALERAGQHNLGNVEHLTLIFDGGFSSDNLTWTKLCGYDFIAGVSSEKLADVKSAYLAWWDSRPDAVNKKPWLLDGRCYYSGRVPLRLGEVQGELRVYCDPAKRAQELLDLTEKRQHLLDELLATQRAPRRKADFDAWAARFAPHFKVVKVERNRNARGFVFTEDENADNDARGLCGNITLFCALNHAATEVSDAEVLRLYRSKEAVEDCFDLTKNALSDKRLHIAGDAQVEGKLLILFVALILRRTLHQRLRDWLQANNYTDEDAIKELEQITFYKHDGKWFQKVPESKTQREIIARLQLDLNNPLPDNPSPLYRPRQRKRRKNKKKA